MREKKTARIYSENTVKDVNSVSYSHSINVILYVLLSRIALNLADIADSLREES